MSIQVAWAARPAGIRRACSDVRVRNDAGAQVANVIFRKACHRVKCVILGTSSQQEFLKDIGQPTKNMDFLEGFPETDSLDVSICTAGPLYGCIPAGVRISTRENMHTLLSVACCMLCGCVKSVNMRVRVKV